jgi:hypothetical protein
LVEECRCFQGRAHFYKQAHLDPGLLFFVGELLDESKEIQTLLDFHAIMTGSPPLTAVESEAVIEGYWRLAQRSGSR